MKYSNDVEVSIRKRKYNKGVKKIHDTGDGTN
jgi:hypothetical protein